MKCVDFFTVEIFLLIQKYMCMYKMYMYIVHVHVYMCMHVLLVTPAQLMKPGIGRNVSCTLGNFHLGLCDIRLFVAKGVVVH